MLLKLGDSVTTDHISPAGAIKKDSPAGKYLAEHGVEQRDFNSYGSRRGNHEVMIRGTFANIRLRNQLAPGTEGGFTRDFTTTTARSPRSSRRPSTTLPPARRWSSWPARSTAPARRATGPPRAPRCSGVKAVIAESYERIHRSNLIGMGVLPLQYPEGETAESLGLTGERRSIIGVTELNDGGTPRTVKVEPADDRTSSSTRSVRIDTPVRPTTTATAGSCSTCSAACARRSWRRDVVAASVGPVSGEG